MFKSQLPDVQHIDFQWKNIRCIQTIKMPFGILCYSKYFVEVLWWWAYKFCVSMLLLLLSMLQSRSYNIQLTSISSSKPNNSVCTLPIVLKASFICMSKYFRFQSYSHNSYSILTDYTEFVDGSIRIEVRYLLCEMFSLKFNVNFYNFQVWQAADSVLWL